jgi:hypothetical protein
LDMLFSDATISAKKHSTFSTYLKLK